MIEKDFAWIDYKRLLSENKVPINKVFHEIMREDADMFRGMRGLAITMCSLMLLVSLDVNAARYYKSIDENGKVVFSDRPTSTTVEQIDVKVFTPDVPAPPVPGAKNRDKDVKKKAGEESAQKDLKALQTTRDENCKKAKNRLSQLQTVSRLYTEDEKGVRSYVSDEARVKQLEEARGDVEDWCK